MLVGRSGEVAHIDRLLEAAREGRSGALVIRGEAGIGKSALLEHARAGAEDMTVLRAGGVEVESELAYAALHQMLRPVLDRADRLPAPQAAALDAAFALSRDGGANRFHLSLAALGLLSDAGEERPVLCLVDDAQWLDQASADVLLFVARRLEAESVVILFAAREDAAAFRAGGLPQLELSGLSPGDARMLLDARLPAGVAPHITDWVLESANGNPLALVELPASLTPAQLDGRDPLLDAAPATSVEAAYVARVHVLPAPTRELLLLAAAEETGERRTITAAARELGLEPAQLEPAERESLVRVGQDRIEFRHPLVRSAVYRGAGFAERERVHQALAAVLSDPADADRRAWHRAAAVPGHDDEVADELDLTAERARLRGGQLATAAALERAAALTSDEPRRAQRLTAAANAAWLGGRPRHAGALVDRVVQLEQTPETQARALRLRGLVELRCGFPAKAYDLLTEAARQVGPSDPRIALETLAEARDAASFSGDVAGMSAVGRLVDELPPFGEDGDRALVYVLSGIRHLVDGDPARGAPLLREAIELAGAVEDSQHLIWIWPAALYLGDFDTGRQIIARAVARARRVGTLGVLPIALERLAFSEFWCGLHRSATANATEAVRLSREMGQDDTVANGLTTLAVVAAAEGREDDCVAATRELIDLAAARRLGLFHSSAQWALALLELGLGRPADALARLRSAAPTGAGRLHPSVAAWAAPDHVEAAVREGSLEAAQAIIEQHEQWAVATGLPRVLSGLARCRGLVTEGEAAESHFAEAVGYEIGEAYPFDHARARLLYGEFLRRARRRTESREHLRQAFETFERLGAAPWAERAGNELRATGENARRRDASAVDQLTPQELQIASLVGEGASNKEVAAQLFLSPRTVEYHLRKVFTKLGISSRSELIRQGVAGELTLVS